MRRILLLLIFTSFIAVVQASAAGPTELIFPIYAFTNVENCRFWSTVVILFNPNATATAVTVNGFDKDGSLIESRSVSVDPFTSSVFGIVRTNIHWLKVTGSESVFAREILQVIKCSPPDLPPGTLGIADVLTMLDLRPGARDHHHFAQISYNDRGVNTGVAIVFPAATGTAPATGKLIHRGTDGQKISEKDIVIPANGQFAGMISEILPDSLMVSSSISGSLEIVFDQEVAVAAIQFGLGQPLEEPALQSLSGIVQP